MLPRDPTTDGLDECRWLAERLAALGGIGTFRVGAARAHDDSWSPGMRAVHGVDGDAPVPGVDEYCERFVHADDRDAVRRHFELALRHPSGEADVEYSIVRADARPRRVRVSVRAFTRPDGTRCLVGALQDVSDGALALREPLARHDRLATLTRLAVTGEMASGFAHQISQPLTALVNYAGVAARLAGPHASPRLSEALAGIAEEAERAAHLARRIRALAGLPLGDVAPTDLNGLLQETVPLLEPLARRMHVGLLVDPHPALPRVSVDPTAIQLAVINLVCNAIEASAATGLPGLVVELGTAVADGAVEIVVRDRGVGLRGAAASQLFLPFFTTKSSAAGLGLGIASAIADQHAGSITLTANPGGGATARLTVPTVPPAAVEQEPVR